MEYKNLTLGNCNGTSFHFGIVNTTLNELIKFLGAEHEECEPQEKVQHYFERCVTCVENGVEKAINFSIYDWKEYRAFGADDEIEFHIGTENTKETETIIGYLKQNGFNSYSIY